MRAQIYKRSDHNCGSWVVLGYGLFGSPKILVQKIFGYRKRVIPISLENTIVPAEALSGPRFDIVIFKV